MRFLVERRGFEPLTPTLPVLCAPNCANAPFGYPSIIPHFPGFVKSFLEKVLTNPVFSGIIKVLRNFRNQGNTRRQGFIRFAVKTQGRESVGAPQFCRVRALPAGGGCFLLHRRSEFLFLPPILSEGGDGMGYITLADLLQFSAFVLSLITTILAILSFINKKK